MTGQQEMFQTLKFHDGELLILDQTELPMHTVTVRCRRMEDVEECIMSLRVRGAPAIGCAGAYGAVLAAVRLVGTGLTGHDLHTALMDDFARLERARPTAINLSWAVSRMRAVTDRHMSAPASTVVDALKAEADRILAEDERANRALAVHGAALIPRHAQILTHCNAGALATGSYGTALGVIRAARESGKEVHVWVDETRPLLQGARLTAWELQRLKIPFTLITDSMAGHFMARGSVDCVVVGADRVAVNGDTANKIGTYSVAVLARAHGVPFFVAAPTSTVDLATASGAQIPIEERQPAEVSTFRGVQTAPVGARIANPAFDVTPAHLIEAIITEHGVAHAPFEPTLRAMVAAAKRTRDPLDTPAPTSNRPGVARAPGSVTDA